MYCLYFHSFNENTYYMLGTMLHGRNTTVNRKVQPLHHENARVIRE